MSELRDRIRDFAPSFGLVVEDAVLSRLVAHFELLVRWNEKINLTRIVDASEAARFHYLESLWLSERVGPCSRIVDVGSGAGFPGIPIAIARPKTPVLLVEAHVRKATFLRECVRSLELKNVRVIAERFHGGHVASDDFVVSRAVERLDTVLPSLLDSAAREVLVLTFREMLATARNSRRDLEVVPVPLAANRVLGRFGERSVESDSFTWN